MAKRRLSKSEQEYRRGYQKGMKNGAAVMHEGSVYIDENGDLIMRREHSKLVTVAKVAIGAAATVYAAKKAKKAFFRWLGRS